MQRLPALVLIALAAVPGMGRASGVAAPGAGEPPGTAPVIVVTAPSGADSVVLADSPVNAQVLTARAFDRQHQANLADLLDANIASVSLGNGTGSPYQSDVAYRGFQATSLPGSPNGLSVWLDGVRLNEPFGSTVNWDLIPLNAIRTVSVLPGSNPLFGLNTLGGSLVLTTRNGADDGGLAATVQGGSFARAGAQAQAGGSFAGHRFDWFVAGTFDTQQGYRQHSHTRVAQGFAKLRWRGGASNAELGVVWADTALSGTQGLPLSMLDTPQAAYTWPDRVANRQVVINLRADTRLSDALRLSGNLYFRHVVSHAVNSNASLADTCDSPCGGLAPGGTAIDRDAATGYAGPLPLHDYTGAINTSLVASNLGERSLGGNLLLDRDAALAGLTHDLNLGFGFELAQVRYGQDSALARLIAFQTVPLATNPRYFGGDGNPLINVVAVASHNAAFTLFVRDMVRLTPRLSLTGSLALTATRVSLSGTNTTLLDPGGAYAWTAPDGTAWVNPAYAGARYWDPATQQVITAQIPSGALIGPEVEPVAGAHSYHRVNPTLGLTWNPQSALGLFASFSQAMRAPTAIELACADPARPCALPTGFNGDPALRAVVAHSLELGLRGTIARHVAVNAALWRTRVDNDIQFVFGASGLGYFANPGRTQRQGFELGLSADWPRVHVSAGYGLVDATYRDGFVDAQGAAVAPGRHIAGIPRQTFKLRAELHPLQTVRIGANLIAATSQVAHGDEAGQGGAVPGYAVAGIDGAVTLRRDWDLFVKVTNLFDRRYATFGVLGTNVYTGSREQFRTPAPGRAVLAGITRRFGARAGPAPE